MYSFLEKYQHKLNSREEYTLEDWRNTGLLNNLAKEQEPQVIELFELSIPWMFENKNDTEKIKLLFPLINRVYTELIQVYPRFLPQLIQKNQDQSRYNYDLVIYHLIEIEHLISTFTEYYKKTFTCLKHYKHIESDVYFLEMFTREYVKILINEVSHKSQSEMYQYFREKKINKII